MANIKFKFCGITNTGDAQLAIDLKANFIGLIFCKSSPRLINMEQAQKIVNLNFQNTLKVGVFVNSKIDEVLKIINEINLDVIQLHGDEEQSYLEEIKNNSHPQLQIWKSFRVRDENSIKGVKNYLNQYFLLDKYSDYSYGGTGKRIGRELLKPWLNLQGQGKKIILAGGINFDNVGEFIKLNPWAIDINSGVEDFPGKKNHNLMKAIVKKILL